MHIEEDSSHCFLDTSFIVDCDTCNLVLSATDTCESTCDSCWVKVVVYRNMIAVGSAAISTINLSVYDAGNIAYSINNVNWNINWNSPIASDSLLVDCNVDSLILSMDSLNYSDSIHVIMCGQMIYNINTITNNYSVFSNNSFYTYPFYTYPTFNNTFQNLNQFFHQT